VSSYDNELLIAAGQLIARDARQRGRLPLARIRRSISTSYYAIFHFILDEVGRRIVGTDNHLRIRRQLLGRTISHRAIKGALAKVRGASVEASVAEFFGGGAGAGKIPTPAFVSHIASVFADAQAKRHDADYNLGSKLSETDARLLVLRVRKAIETWRSARTAADRDFKQGLVLLIVLKGQLRADAE
jgi:hypothetical protein